MAAETGRAHTGEGATEGGGPDTGPQPWEEPKLTFIEPTLTNHGSLEDVTAGYFGGFTP